MLKPSATKTASQYLTMMIKKGWPITRDEVFKFYNYGEEMMVQNSVIFKGQRIFVPTEMRHTLIKRSHSVHQGIDTSIRRARNSLFWHSMSADIKAKVENCGTCQQFADKQQRGMMLLITSYPNQTLGYCQPRSYDISR